MINILQIVLLIICYALNSFLILKKCQEDNYHLRSFKRVLIQDISKRPYLFFIALFLFVKQRLIISYALILLLLIIIIEIIDQNKLKIKKTKRMRRLLGLSLIPILLIFIFKPFLNGLLIINTFYLLTNFLVINISNLLEKIILTKYIKEAKKRIKKYNPYIIGITGSCGKTSIKNYIYECLQEELLTYKSPKSYNTLIGLLITINKYLNCYENTLILEMGLAYRKDIKKITKIIKPNISIISEILPSHLETMKSIDNIIDEKMQIIKYMKKDGLIIINNDNEYIRNNIDKYNINNNKIVKIGFNNQNDYYCSTYKIKKDGLEFKLVDKILKKEYLIKSNLIGKHNIYNVLIVYSVLKQLKIEENRIIKYISTLSNYENRLELKRYNELTILNDSYNSNIEGFKNALEVLSLYEGEKYIITPGIVESGKENKKIIKEITDKIIKICDYCYIIDNKNTKYFIEEFNNKKYYNYIIKNSFNEAFNEVKNKKITLLIENDLTDFYLNKK